MASSKQAEQHKRGQSTGTVNALGPKPKRAPFGDVSNTAKTLNARDDLALAGKPVKVETVKHLVQASQAPAQGTFFKEPAKQIKVHINPASDPPARAPQTDKQATSKDNTSIYQDPQVQNNQPSRPATSSNTTIDQTNVATSRPNLEPRHHKSQPQLKTAQPVLRRTQSKILDQGVSIAEGILPNEPIYEDAREDQGPTAAEGYEQYLALLERKNVEPVYDEPQPEQGGVDIRDRELPAPPIASETEEYWEDEEEEIYEEQGYSTAHSYRSRGDNTTGGATTVLFPKVTKKAEKEILEAKIIVEAARTQEEIEDEAWDTSMVAEYGEEIFEYMRELEKKMLPNPHYMDNQAEIQWSMRSVLMDWLIQVHHRFSLLPETLFLCVNYIDRFLSQKIVSLGKLQLVGATAIFVAAKYEEINCPSVSEIVYMVDGGYTVDEILKAERFMLSMLSFELGWPGPMSFLRRISKADDYDLETRTLAKYFLEVTIMDERFVGSPPSYIAAGAHCFARFMLRKGDWTPAHVHYSGYTWTQLRPLVSMILECCEHPQKHHAAVYDKYADRRYKRASKYVEEHLAKGFVLPSIQLPPTRLSLPTMEDVHAHMPFETRDSFKRMVQVKN
ncbi:cyclin-like protein [Tricladium varicosporioides]|nr:cyclin-like protein [Hymenoscyphus varicosporioides]